MEILLEIQRALGRIEGQVNGIAETQKVNTTRMGAIEARVARVERNASVSKARRVGWMAGAGSVGGIVVAGVKWLLG